MPIEPAVEPTEWATLQGLFNGPGNYINIDEAGNIIPVPRITMGPPSVYDVMCGLDYAPGCAAAHARWLDKTTMRDVVSGVATWTWPAASAPEMTSIQRFTAALGQTAVSLVIPYITDAACLLLEPRTHILRARVLNEAIPSLPTSFGTGGIPMRLLPGVSAVPVPHGQIVEYEIAVVGNAIGYVREARVLGDTVPPTTTLVAAGRATAASPSTVTQVPSGSYNPYLYAGETEILLGGRTTGTGWTPPTGFAHPTDPDVPGGGALNGTSSSLKIAVRSTRIPEEGAVAGSGTSSNQQFQHISAWRGVAPTDYKSAVSTGATVTFPTFDNIAPGGFVLYAIQANMGTAPNPAGASLIGSLPVVQGGWSWRVVRVEPDAGGDVAPPNLTITAAVVEIIAIRMEPV